jgi:hypothetical protein
MIGWDVSRGKTNLEKAAVADESVLEDEVPKGSDDDATK